MRARAAVAVILVSAAIPVAASDAHSIDVRVIPPQRVTAITIRNGESVRSVEVRNGKAAVPVDLPMPWSLGMTRFEADLYTREHLEQKRPWAIRELGILRGTAPRARKDERFTWLLQRAQSEEVDEVELIADERGSLELRLPAGTYQGALVGRESATRIRSGMVIVPGRTTDLGSMTTEPTIPVVLRVLDAQRRAAVPDARVTWDPPGEMLNAALSRRLYARRWSATTDRRGVAEIRAIGPLPHSARWTIEAKGFARAHTTAVLLKEPGRFNMPDVQLRPQPTVTVRVQLPQRDTRDLDGATLVVGEERDPRSHVITRVSSTPLREGESRFTFTSYGPKRIWVESGTRKPRAWEGGERRKLYVQEVDVTTESTFVDVELRPVEIRGRVTQRGQSIADVLLVLTAPKDGRDFLSEAVSDENGAFRFTTWAAGQMHLYTIGPQRGPGRRSGTARATVDLTGRRELVVDLEIPSSGFRVSVVDRESGAPVGARIDIRAQFEDGTRKMTMEDTDERGRLDVSGFLEGTAILSVTADGYRGATAEIIVDRSQPEATVQLEPARPLKGRVVDLQGGAVVGAQIVGGYRTEHDVQPLYFTSTDAQGRFRFDSPPPPHTTFYVIAGGYALASTSLAPERETMIALHPPSSSIVTLRQDHKPPEKVFLVMAAPAGSGFIPTEVLADLADANGMSLYQLCGSSVTGEVVLPEFLAPGTYELFLARRGGKPFLYERVGTIRTPLASNTVLPVSTLH